VLTFGHGDQPAAVPRFAGTGAGPDAGPGTGRWGTGRLGKRAVRPGGLELTRWMLDALAVGTDDRVVELAVGLGATARLVLARHPAGYIGVDRDPAAVAALSLLPHSGPTEVCGHRADLARTGLPAGRATVVYGETTLTMLPGPAKHHVVREARRLLADDGRYAVHELCLIPDDLSPAAARRIGDDLGGATRAGAYPLTVSGWRDLLTAEGFTVTAQRTAPMVLLEPRRMVADEGLAQALGVVGRTLRDGAARRRALETRRVFRRHRVHLGAVTLCAVPTRPLS
jgi:hypothetical protein